MTGRVRRLLHKPLAACGLVAVLILVVAAIFAPYLAPDGVRTTHFNLLLAHPSRHHLLGTDELGRDVFSRLVWGARASLQVALFSTALALLVAVPLGLVAGYYRGAVDTVVARATDVLLAFPFLILAIGLAAILGPSLATATIALGVAAAPGFIRIARGGTLALRETDFVAAAEAVGASDARIVFRQVLPNLSGPLVTQATIMIPRAIVGEATLSYLGLGMRPPGASWGVMLQDARSYLYAAPRLAVYPGIAIAVASLAFILLGDGLRDVLDPRSS
jgi:peptide/nickel transport system permease protein